MTPWLLPPAAPANKCARITFVGYLSSVYTCGGVREAARGDNNGDEDASDSAALAAAAAVDDEDVNDIISDDIPFDDIIDLSDEMNM